MNIPKTIIEFIEPTETPEAWTCHKAREVRINGIPVLVKADSTDIEYGDSDITQVTLTLLPTEIHFRAAKPYATEGEQ